MLILSLISLSRVAHGLLVKPDDRERAGKAVDVVLELLDLGVLAAAVGEGLAVGLDLTGVGGHLRRGGQRRKIQKGKGGRFMRVGGVGRTPSPFCAQRSGTIPRFPPQRRRQPQSQPQQHRIPHFHASTPFERKSDPWGYLPRARNDILYITGGLFRFPLSEGSDFGSVPRERDTLHRTSMEKVTQRLPREMSGQICTVLLLY